MTASCEQCPLGVAQAVASRGPVPARALFLSGAPRYHEEHAGMAFASPLFSWLEERFAAAGIDPADVHYATLIGCRPPQQRPLRPQEIAACAPRLDVTIKAVEPCVIVLCGPDAVAALLPGVSLSAAHGTLMRRGRRRYYPLRHPYAALHSERYVDEVENDLRRLSALLTEEWPDEGEDGAREDGALEDRAPVSSGSTLALSGGHAARVAPTTPDGLAPGQDGGPDRLAADDVVGDDVVGDDATQPAEEGDSPTQLSLF